MMFQGALLDQPQYLVISDDSSQRGKCIFIAYRVQRLAVALPRPGEYMHDVFLMKELPGAISCILPDKTKLSLTLQDCFLALRVKV